MLTERGAPHRETAQAPPLPVRPGAQDEILSSLCMWEDSRPRKEHKTRAMYTGSGR